MDEFQNLAQFPNYESAEKKMRSVWQKQKQVVYCLYGSKRHMMEEIFTSSSKPFYKFGDLFWLPKIKTEKWISFIKNGFTQSGKTIDESFVEKIPLLMKNHSWYVQQFSYYVWAETNSEVTSAIFNDALQKLVNSNLPLFQKIIEDLSIGQINLLKAIIKGEQQLSAKATLAEYQLGTSASALKNKQTLINKDILNSTENGLELLDPVFELWFKKVYFNEVFL